MFVDLEPRCVTVGISALYFTGMFESRIQMLCFTDSSVIIFKLYNYQKKYYNLKQGCISVSGIPEVLITIFLFDLLQVFNMNAPVPPVNEPETLKQQNQYQASYNQSFPSQPHQVEQTELQQDQLQTGKKARVTFYGFVVVFYGFVVVCACLLSSSPSSPNTGFLSDSSGCRGTLCRPGWLGNHRSVFLCLPELKAHTTTSQPRMSSQSSIFLIR